MSYKSGIGLKWKKIQISLKKRWKNWTFLVVHKKWRKKTYLSFFFKLFSKISEYSFIQDQSQICNSNRLKVRARQSELLLFRTFWIQLNCKIEHGNVFIHSCAISKWIKLKPPATSHLKDLLQIFQTATDFLYFISSV